MQTNLIIERRKLTIVLGLIRFDRPEAGLIAKAGTIERAEIMKWLSLVATDLHKSFSPLFALTRISQHADAQEDIKKWSFANIDKYLSLIDKHLQDKTYLAGEKFTIADCYLFTVYQWTSHISFPTDKYTALNRYAEKLANRPSVMAVHEREMSNS